MSSKGTADETNGIKEGVVAVIKRKNESTGELEKVKVVTNEEQ